MRYVWPALLTLMFAAACSSGSGAKATPSSAPSTAAAGGATAPAATPSAAATRGPQSTPPLGTAIAVGTVVATGAVGVDPAVTEEINVMVHRQIDALNAAKLDDLYDLYSTCARKRVTKEQLGFGRAATGTVTLLGISVLNASASTALVQIETQTQIFVGNQNHFRVKSNLVREGGGWKVDATNPADCQR